MAKRSPKQSKAMMRPFPEAVRAALMALNPREQKFVLAYCGEANGNGKLAATLAGYAPRSAQAQASWMTTLPLVRTAIEAWMTHYALSPVLLTAMIADLAQVHPGPFTKVNPVTKELEYEVTAENWERYRHWVRALEVDEHGNVVKLILHDAQKAQATLAKIYKLFSDAPQLVLKVYFQQKSDAELQVEVEEMRKQIRGTALLGRG